MYVIYIYTYTYIHLSTYPPSREKRRWIAEGHVITDEAQFSSNCADTPINV